MHTWQWFLSWFIKCIWDWCHLLLFTKQSNGLSGIQGSADWACEICPGQWINHSVWFCLLHVYLRRQSSLHLWNPWCKGGKLKKMYSSRFRHMLEWIMPNFQWERYRLKIFLYLFWFSAFYFSGFVFTIVWLSSSHGQKYHSIKDPK